MTEVTSGVVRGLVHGDAAAVAFNRDIATPKSIAKTDMRVKKVELVVRCQELARFLRGFDEQPWAGWLEDCVAEMRQNSVAGIEMLIEGYSGIGSISDMYLCPEAHHRVTARDEVAINEQFLLMLAKVHNLAREIQSVTPAVSRKVMRNID